MNYIILVFESTHRVLKAEKILLDKKVKFDIITTPKDISSDCGMAIRINPLVSNQNEIETLLTESGIVYMLYKKEMQ
jgi:hypothetical protein